MSNRFRHRGLFVLALTIPLVSCGGDRSPVSPSAAGAPVVAGAAATSAPSDYHEVPTPTPMPEPMPTPAPTPTPTPPPATATTISIVGSAGRSAFAPNPLSASAGATVVWTNNDVTMHRIVLDDVAGTVIGSMAPGESSAPFTVTEAMVSYRCTLHPSMAGTIQNSAPAAPTPAPAPDPSPRGLQGVWTTVFGGQQATLTLTETGYEVMYGLEHHIGSIAIRGDQIEFSGGNLCSGPGTYLWSLDGDSLVLRAVGRDSCPGRSTALNNRTYTRSS